MMTMQNTRNRKKKIVQKDNYRLTRSYKTSKSQKFKPVPEDFGIDVYRFKEVKIEPIQMRHNFEKKVQLTQFHGT